MGKNKFYLFSDNQRKKLLSRLNNQLREKFEYYIVYNKDHKYDQEIEELRDYYITKILCRHCKEEIITGTIIKAVPNSKSQNVHKFKKLSFIFDSHIYHLHCAERLNQISYSDVPSHLAPFLEHSLEVYGIAVKKHKRKQQQQTKELLIVSN